MIKVILAPANTINVNQLFGSGYYGVKYDGYKGFIKIVGNVWRAVHGPCFLMDSPLASAVTEDDMLPDYVTNLINAGAEVYSFNSPKELFRWVFE
jgi:hypothetical protein